MIINILGWVIAILAGVTSGVLFMKHVVRWSPDFGDYAFTVFTAVMGFLIAMTAYWFSVTLVFPYTAYIDNKPVATGRFMGTYDRTLSWYNRGYHTMVIKSGDTVDIKRGGK